MKKVIVEVDGREVVYNTLSACAKALGVSVATVHDCASYGYKCKGLNVRYADGTRRVRVRDDSKVKVKSTVADNVAGLIARWYIREWQGEYVSTEAMSSLIKYLRDNLGSDPQ